MGLLKLAVLSCLAIAVYKHWPGGSGGASRDAEARTSERFVAMPAVANQAASAVLVLADPTCPKPPAERARRLVRELKGKGIQVVHTPLLQFAPTASPVDGSQVDRTMRGTQPIVFVNGRAKGNPTLDEIVEELRRGM